jgi:MFS family permease
MNPRQRATLIVLLSAGFTLAVDFSILNVALPAVGADIGLTDLQWVGTTFALCAAGFTLLSGRVADLVGRRKVFLLGMALLGLGSLVGGLADTPWLLLTARAAQGLATAAVTPAALSLLTTSFPEGPLRDKALGINGSLMAAGFTTGAVLGGVLTDVLSWRWAFFLNVPVAAAVLIAAPMVLTESTSRAKLDVPGAVAVTLGLLAVVFGLTTYTPALALGAVLLVVFWLVERRAANPLVPVRVLRRRNIAVGNVAGLLAFATETSLVFVLTIYLQRDLGYTPLGAGLAFAVLGVGTVLGGIVAPRVIARVGNRRAIVAGFVVQATATVPLVYLGMPWLLLATFVGGVANLVVIVGFMVTATNGLPDGEQGLATGLATMSQQVGITLGTPVMSVFLASGVATAIYANTALCLLAALLVTLSRGRVRSRPVPLVSPGPSGR